MVRCCSFSFRNVLQAGDKHVLLSSLCCGGNVHISRNVPLISYLCIQYTRDICMFPPPITQIGQVQRRHFREIRKYSSNQMIVMRIQGCPPMPLPQKVNKALIGPYEGSWWLKMENFPRLNFYHQKICSKISLNVFFWEIGPVTCFFLGGYKLTYRIRTRKIIMDSMSD